MKYAIRKFFIMFLAFCLMASTLSFASATGTDGSRAVEPSPDPGGGSTTTLYTLSASKLTGLKTTSKFYKSDLPSGDTKLVASGKLTHTVSGKPNVPTIRAGFGFVAAGSTTILPQYYEDYPGNTATVYESVSISNLTTGGRYCGIIKNLSPDYGTVSGSIKIYTY